MTTKKDPDPAPIPSPKRRPQSDARRAAGIVDKLAALDAAEAEELASTPAMVRAKYEVKRENLVDGESVAVFELVGKMRG